MLDKYVYEVKYIRNSMEAHDHKSDGGIKGLPGEKCATLHVLLLCTPLRLFSMEEKPQSI